MSQPSARRTNGSFRSRYDNDGLLFAAGDIVRHVRQGERRWIKQDEYDVARREAGHHEAPTARQTCQRLHLSWREVQLAFDPQQVPMLLRTSASRSRNAPRDAPALDEIVQSLHAVALASDARSLRPHEYVAGRETMLALDDRAWGHGRRARTQLLRVDQIEVGLRALSMTWDDGLDAAGLDRRQKQVRLPALTPVEGYELFVKDCGCMPTRTQLQRYVRGRGLQMTEFKKVDRPRSSFVARLEAAGVSVPPPCGKEFIPPAGEPLSLNGVAASRQTWSYARCVEGVARAFRKLDGEHRLDQRKLNKLASADPLIPSYSTLYKHMKAEGQEGGLAGAIRDALALR